MIQPVVFFVIIYIEHQIYKTLNTKISQLHIMIHSIISNILSICNVTVELITFFNSIHKAVCIGKTAGLFHQEY